MYRSDVELDAEIDELRRQITMEASEESSEEISEENCVEADADKLLAERIRALFGEGVSEDDIVNTVSEALQTAGRVYKVGIDTDELVGQEENVREIFPDFDIVAELKGNTVFKRLIANGIGVHKALLVSNDRYAQIVADGIRLDAKREMAEQLRQGRERISPYVGANRTSAETDVAAMSEAQFEEIEKKVKKNKKVFI